MSDAPTFDAPAGLSPRPVTKVVRLSAVQVGWPAVRTTSQVRLTYLYGAHAPVELEFPVDLRAAIKPQIERQVRLDVIRREHTQPEGCPVAKLAVPFEISGEGW